MHSTVKGAIIGGILVIIAPFIWQGLSLPDPVWVASGRTDSICQQNLDFRDGFTPFVFSYTNLGSDKGIFEATTSSDEVLLKYTKSNQEFASKNSKDWTVDVDKTITFEFVLNLPENIEEPETITIDTELACRKNVIGGFAIPCGYRSYTCEYQNQHTKYFGPNYELAN